MDEQLISEESGGWSDARIERALSSSGQRVSTLSETRRAEMLQALLAENARLAAVAQAQQPPKRSFWDNLRELVTPRTASAMGAVFAVIVAISSYVLLGGSRAPVAASANGSFALAERRLGPLGMTWTLPRSYANTSNTSLHVGDQVVALSPVTVTFPGGVEAVVASGTQLTLLPSQGIELVQGEIIANAEQISEEFKVASVGTTFVVTDATFRVKVDPTGVVSQFTDHGLVVAQAGDGPPVEVHTGEQSSVVPGGVAEKALQAPVVAGQKEADGTLAFTARTSTGSTVVVRDSQTGTELAQFQADENGIVSAQIIPPPGTTAASIEFVAKDATGRQSESAAAVSDGSAIASESPITSLPPAPVERPSTNVPVLTLPALAPIQATSRGSTPVTFEVSATDSVDGAVAVTCNIPSGSPFQIGLTPVTCTAVNSRGRTATGTFTVNVVDRVPPVLRLPADRAASAVNQSGAAVTFNVSASDAVDGAITPNCTMRSGATFPLGPTSVECTATDASGNVVQGRFMVTVRDTTAPTLQLPDSIVAPATSRSGAEVSFQASAIDAVDGPVSVTCSPRSGAAFGNGSQMVTCTATDKAGNNASGSFQITVRDITPPVITVPDNLTVQADRTGGAQVTFNVTSNDTVDGATAVTCSPRSGATFPFGATTVTCRSTDAQGNSTSKAFTVNVVDTSLPTLTLPREVTATATSPNGAPVSFTITANDAVDGSLTPVCTPRSGSVFKLGSTVVTCRVTDTRGNQASGTFNVSVVDASAPILTLPANLTAEAVGPSGATVSFSASARDAVDGPIVPTCTPASDAAFDLGRTTVTCRATDKAGNVASDSFNVTVVDTKAPVLKLPEDMRVRATLKTGTPVTFTVAATDVVDGNLTPVCTPRSGTTFPFGATPVTCRATDAAGNAVSGSFTVNVLDEVAPVLSMPANQTIEATSGAGAVVTFTVNATDAVDGPITPLCDPRAGATFPLGTTTVTCRARDEAGNQASDSFRVNVVDTAAPTFSLPVSQTVEATSRNGAVVEFTVTASDRVDARVDVTCTPRSGSAFGFGTTNVTCTAVDDAGNTATGSFPVTVRDSLAPAINLPSALTVEAVDGNGAPVTFSATATDAVDGPLSPICTPASGTVFGLGTRAVTCRVADAAGNAASGAFNVNVVDTTAPGLTLPANITLQAISGGTPATYTATANDTVSGPVAVTCDYPSGSAFPVGTTTVTCRARDVAGNTATGTFPVIIQDSVAPVLSLPNPITVQTDNPAGIPVTYIATATDVVDGALGVTCNIPSGATFAPGTTMVTCTATDRAGNTASGGFTVTVLYVAPPTATPPPATATPPAATPPPATATPVTPTTPGSNETPGSTATP